jgi:hypothetical protein
MDPREKAVSVADHQLRLCISRLRAAATHIYQARARFAWRSASDQALEEVHRGVARLERDAAALRTRLDDLASGKVTP